MSESNDKASEKSILLIILGILATVSFFTTLFSGSLIVYLFLRPRSNFADWFLTILSVGRETSPAVALESVIDLLIGATGVTASLSLSLALAAIYLSQNRILNTQSNIHRMQTDIMKNQRVPVITVHESGIRLHGGRPTLEKVRDDGSLAITETGDTPHVSVGVENHGDEIAEQIQLACLVDVPSTSDPQIHTGVSELNTDGMFTKPRKGKGAILPPSKNFTLLRGTPILSSSPTDVTNRMMFVGGIAEQLQSLRDQALNENTKDSDPSVVRFGFVLIFTNSVGQDFQVPLSTAYSVDATQFEEDEEITLPALEHKAVDYDIDDLIEESGWTIPEATFERR